MGFRKPVTDPLSGQAPKPAAPAASALPNEQALRQQIEEFHARCGDRLRYLAQQLDLAHISHYSSGCESRYITFEIFPASAYVLEMVRMISLDREHKPRSSNGFRDADRRIDYCPGVDFLHFLRRWSGYAEQVMRSEGSSPRGVAAARALVTMQELGTELSEGRASTQLRATSFVRMVSDIGFLLESKHSSHHEQSRTQQTSQHQDNYQAALTAAGTILSATNKSA
jgi:hypothetical protein